MLRKYQTDNGDMTFDVDTDGMVAVNNGERKWRVSVEQAIREKLTYDTVDEQRMKRSAHGLKEMSHADTMKQLNAEKNRLKNELAALKVERSPEVMAHNEPAIYCEIDKKDRVITAVERHGGPSNIDSLDFYVDKKSKTVVFF